MFESSREEDDVGVRLLGRLFPLDKISLDIQREIYRSWALDSSRTHLKVLIEFHGDISTNQSRGELDVIPGIFVAGQHGPRTWAAAMEIASIVF